jgi:diguanylate cyclase (GGDEF)-like protein
MNRELTEASLTDALTGLRNRRYLKFHLEQAAPPSDAAVDRRQAAPGHFVLCLFDLDHFKQINDRFGHEIGDAVLVEVARRLRATLRSSDGLLRWGGEEFLVVGRGFDIEGSTEFARRVQACISAEPMRMANGQVLRVTCSLGFAPLPWIGVNGDRLSRDQVLNLADIALYLSKLEGRNRGYGVFPGPEAGLTTQISDLGMDPRTLRGEDGKGIRLRAIIGPSAS